MDSIAALDHILYLCAKIRLTENQYRQLVNVCSSFERWDELLHQAEGHGLAPLVNHHLVRISKDADIPPSILRGLKILSLRHNGANTILQSSLKEILQKLESEGINCLVLKGAALSQTVYPEIGYRPMRDIDLLLHKRDVHRAHSVLQQIDYCSSNEKLPKDYYHLPPLFKEVQGMQVCVELHSGIFPDDPPYYTQLDFDTLYRDRKDFDVDGYRASCFAYEEMLWHVFQHGFRAPLTYERARLVALADLVNIVEERLDEIDWQTVAHRYPSLINALSLFHKLCPWSEKVQTKGVIPPLEKSADTTIYYDGWPSQQSQQPLDSWKGFARVARETLFPSKWWVMMYYGCSGRFSLFRGRMVSHPIHLLRWLKLHVTKRR